MPRAKRKPKKIGLFQSMMKAAGFVPAPKKRPGKKVSVKPYVRKSPVKTVSADNEIPLPAGTQRIFTEV